MKNEKLPTLSSCNSALVVVLGLQTLAYWSILGGLIVSTSIRIQQSLVLQHPKSKVMVKFHTARDVILTILKLSRAIKTNLFYFCKIAKYLDGLHFSKLLHHVVGLFFAKRIRIQNRVCILLGQRATAQPQNIIFVRSDVLVMSPAIFFNTNRNVNIQMIQLASEIVFVLALEQGKSDTRSR